MDTSHGSLWTEWLSRQTWSSYRHFHHRKKWKSDLVTSQLVTILTLPEATAVPTVYNQKIIVVCITTHWSIAGEQQFETNQSANYILCYHEGNVVLCSPDCLFPCTRKAIRCLSHPFIHSSQVAQSFQPPVRGSFQRQSVQINALICLITSIAFLSVAW